MQHFFKHKKLVFLFIAGALSAITVALIGGDRATAALRYAKLTSVAEIFESRSVFIAFVELLKHCSAELIAITAIAFSSVTLFSDTLFSLSALIKGVTFGRLFGALLHEFSDNVFLGILSCLYLFVINLLFLYYCFRIRDISLNWGKKNSSDEPSAICASDALKCMRIYLTATGSVILIALFKTIIIWLINRI